MTATNPPDIEVIPAHVAALAEIKAKSDRVRYAADQAPDLSVPDLLHWLAAHGANPAPSDDVEIGRTYAAGIVRSYREGRKATDTGDLPKLTDEVLAELDAVRADDAAPAVQTEITPVEPEPETVIVVRTAPVEPVPALDVEPTPAVVTEPPATPERPRGAGLFYAVAVVATGVSVNTSWRFFGERLHIPTLYGERGVMFGVLELALVACGVAMRANVRRPQGTPGSARMLAWALCGVSAYMAIALSGPTEGLARVILGPVLALVALHLALGIEVRARRGTRTGTWARVGREVRERALSRLGLADDSRTALARTRDRAADRAARLATAKWAPARRRRLARAVRTSGAALDVAQRTRLVTQVAALQHLNDLVKSDRPSPWV